MKDNNKVYNTESVVKEYESFDFLFPPEQEILKLLTSNPYNKYMLDIGVGAGRTTKYFAPLFEKYTGIDYSEMMIDRCKKKFVNTPYHFQFADATNLADFKNSSFDFVFFSFNGIDCVGLEDRDKALNEIKRVCRPDGWFAFSVHSIYNVRKLYSFQTPRNPLNYLAAYKRMKKVRKMNPELPEVEKAEIISLIDGDLDFSASYVYIKPEFQKKILMEKGYYNIHMFDEKGKEVTKEEFMTWKHQDAWIYFLCRNGK
jgi:ubiquinone/menaquinone biosynthesis C-methylase UbiE